MVLKYIKIAFRNIYRKGIYSLINVLGLTLGLVVTILLTVYIRHELSYDQFYPHSNNIYRVVSTGITTDGQKLVIPHTLFKITDSLKINFPEIEEIGRLFLNPGFVYENRKFNFGHIRFCYVEPAFLRVFSKPGIDSAQLSEFIDPYTAIITEDFARRVFPDEDPVGKKLTIHKKEFLVVGLTNDFPPNSHMDFNLFLSMNTLKEEGILSRRGSLDFPTYIRLADGSDNKKVVDDIRIAIDRWANQHYSGSGVEIYSYLQPVREIHLNSSEIGFNFKPPGRLEDIIIYSTIAIFILIIAISNYLNLILADSVNRIREVSIRKVLGADRRSLLSQFLGESVIISVIALLISVLLVGFLMPRFGYLVDRQLEFPFREYPILLIGMIILTVVISLITGFYPALTLSKNCRLEHLHMHGLTVRPRRLKNVSVFIQITISAFMITCLLVMYKQVVFMKRKDLGFNTENLVVFYKVNQRFAKPFAPVRDKLVEYNEILSVSASDAVPGNIAIVQNAWASNHSTQDKAFVLHENPVQKDFLETYKIELVAGRDFSEEKDCDTCKFIINESAAKMFGLDTLIGEPANIWYHKDTIIGVVKDFHFESLYESIGPLVFTRYKTEYQYISVRTKNKITSETIEYIQKVLQDYFKDEAFNYYIVEDQIRSKHSIDEQNTRLMLFGTILAIFTSALGLFGQISFTVVKRTKEMGIRKTHGANAKNIVALMIGDYGKFVIPAVVIAIPLSILLIRHWMQNFAYKTDISFWIYLSSVSLALIVSLFAILIRVIRFALINPADSLRYE